MSTCTTASAEFAEPVTATAATARTWLLIEQSGPWGRKALTGSRLDPAVGRALDRAADGNGVRVALIRRPGRHPDLHRAGRHRVFVAHTAPGRGWIRTAEVADPAELLDASGACVLDFAALGAGGHGGFGAAYTGPPLVLVCTNGRRDRCCALYGRPLAAELASSADNDGEDRDDAGVWEVTHLGGHRFSPTMLVLPYGYAYGRVDGRLAKDVLEAARSGRIALEGCRGRSTWRRPGQAADLAVRALTGEDREDALTVTGTERTAGGWDVGVAHTDGRSWTVTVAQSASEPPRPESCGAALGTPDRLDAVRVQPAG